MSTIFQRLAERGVSDFFTPTPFELSGLPNAGQLPTVGMALAPYIPHLSQGALPIFNLDGTLWGCVSSFDVAEDVRRAMLSRHTLDTYRFSALKLGKIGTRILGPVRLNDSVVRLIEVLQAGSRRAFVVDDAGKLLGTIELADVIARLVGEFPQLLEDVSEHREDSAPGERKINRVMLHSARDLSIVLAEPLVEFLLRVHRWRRFGLVYVLGRHTRGVTISDALELLSVDGALSGLKVDALPGANPSPLEASYPLPFPVVQDTTSISEALPQLLRSQQLLVMRGETIIGHVDIVQFWSEEILPKLDLVLPS